MKTLNLRNERIKRCWTLEYVGNCVGIAKNIVHDIETGKQKPSYDVLIKLYKLFDVDMQPVEQLFTVADDNLSIK